MLLNRRGALVALGVAAFGGPQSLLSELANRVDDNPRVDLARLEGRVYSEEGVPMFLACENLAASQASSEGASSPSALNRKVASAFHRYAEEWQRVHPQAPASDVAKIVEWLADQDFANGGAEKSL